MPNEESKSVLDSFRKQYDVLYSIADLTPTICSLFGIPEPDVCGGVPIPAVIDQADKLMGGIGKTQKAVLFCADALGESQREHFPDVFEKIQSYAGFRFKSACVMPSVTPVCYASIFTGASPSVHGICKYEKPVLQAQTLFDVFAKAGKNVAICAINTCSIDSIFRKRDIDYYSFCDDERPFLCTLDLIEKGNYDLIVSYMTGYDSWMHECGPFSPECAGQARIAGDRFAAIAEKMDVCLGQYNRVLAFVPDHGGHPVSEKEGGHGTEMPEDMIVNHYYRVKAGK